MINIKIDAQVKSAIQNLTDKQSRPSTVIKQAIEKHLHDHGIDWRKEKDPRS